MLHSFDDTQCFIDIHGKPVRKVLKFARVKASSKPIKFMCLSILTGSKAKRKPSMSGLSNNIDPAPDLRPEAGAYGRQLALIGDNLLESYDTNYHSRKMCIALSIAAAGMAGAALYFLVKEKE